VLAINAKALKVRPIQQMALGTAIALSTKLRAISRRALADGQTWYLTAQFDDHARGFVVRDNTLLWLEVVVIYG
jgi:hypothetical protein